MDLSLLRSTSILNKYSLNAIPRDGDGEGGAGGGSGLGDSWGSSDSGVSYADSGSYFGAFDSGNIGSSGFDSGSYNSSGWDGGWGGGSTYSGNNFDSGGGWNGGGVNYGDAGLGPSGFGTGGFGFNNGAFDYGGGNAFTGLGPGGGGWDAGPWGTGTFGYDQGLGGLYSNPAMDAWGPGSYSAWGGFGAPSAYGGYNGMFGPMSGMEFNSNYGPAFNSFGLNPGAYYNGEGQGWPFDFGNIGPQGSFGYGAGNGLLGYGEVGSWLGGLPDTSGMFAPNGNPLAAPDPGFQAPAYPNEGIQNMPLNEPAYMDIGYQLGGKDQGFVAPDINPLDYPSSTWDAASYFGSPNATTQPQNSRDSFDSRYGEWGAPNANPYVANVITDPNNFEGRFGGPYPAPTQWTSDTYLGPDFGRAGNIAEWGRAAPSNVAALDYPTDTFDARFGGPYPAPTAPDYGPNVATNHGPAHDYGPDLAIIARGGEPPPPTTLSAPDSFDLGEQGRAGRLTDNFDSRFGGPYLDPQEVVGGKTDLTQTPFDSRFGNLPLAQDLQSQMIAAQELGDQGRAGQNLQTMLQNNNVTPQNVAWDFMTGGPYAGVAGAIGRGMDLSGQITANMPWGSTVNAPPALSPGWATPGLLSGLDLSLSNKGDALNNYVSNANQNLSPYGALQQALETRDGIMPDLNETGRSINDVMDAARAAQLNNQNMGREQNYPTLQEFLGDGRTSTPSRSGYDVAPSRDGNVGTRGGRADLSPDNSREAAQTARSVTQSIARGDPNSMAYLNALLQESRTAPTLAGRIAALDALNGIISAMKDAGRPNPFGRDPDPFIASQLRMGR